MLTVKEFCCGFTLRTGSLILLWAWLIAGGFGTLWDGKLIIEYENYRHKEGSRYIIFDLYVKLGISVAWMVTSLLGIVGIHKDKERYITPHLYFQGFYILYSFLTKTWMLLFPRPKSYTEFKYNKSKVMAMRGFNYYFYYEFEDEIDEKMTILWITGRLYITALLVYFWIIIRSCRNAMSENAAGKKVTASSHNYDLPSYSTI